MLFSKLHQVGQKQIAANLKLNDNQGSRFSCFQVF